MRRVFVDERQVGAQRGTREQALEEIVAEQRVFGNAVFERRAESIHVIQSLADEDALVKQILIDV